MSKKIVYLTALMLSFSMTSFSQGFLKKLKEKATNVGSDLIVKKSAEKAEKVVDGKGDKNGKVKEAKNEQDGKEQSSAKGNKGDNGITAYSKFDFVAGEKIVYAENFEQDAIGEFPLKWFTNGSAEVVTVEGLAIPIATL
jgi:OOP family OmpA-OmpF porin